MRVRKIQLNPPITFTTPSVWLVKQRDKDKLETRFAFLKAGARLSGSLCLCRMGRWRNRQLLAKSSLEMPGRGKGVRGAGVESELNQAEPTAAHADVGASKPGLSRRLPGPQHRRA